MLTIFTPTYNRAYTLPRLYESLLKQSDKNFEWIIVNDGSTDNTKVLIDKWISENQINIRYYEQENQGKPMAHNKGTEQARGEIFTCVDSDDFLTPNAVKIINEKWKKCKENEGCTGIVGTCITIDGRPVGTGMVNVRYSTLQDLYNKYKYKGDTILIFRTDIVKRYKFPKIEGEKFIPETYIYDQIDKEGKLATIKEGIYVCEYLKDGYTANSANLIKKNPKGYILVAEQQLNEAKSLKEKVVASAKVILGNWLANEKKYMSKYNHKMVFLLAIPLAYMVYLKKYK